MSAPDPASAPRLVPVLEIGGTHVSGALVLEAAPSEAWGVAVPGPFDEAAGVGWLEGVGKLEALRGFDLGAALRAGLSARPSRVSFVNDAVAFSLGEWRAGAARGHLGRERLDVDAG